MLTIDDLDRRIIHALHLDGRASLTTIAQVLGSSTPTVVRRYGRLRAGAGLRVVGLAGTSGAERQQWIVRITAAASSAAAIGSALSRRSDTSWVRLTSGGTEIAAIITTAPDSPDANALLLRDVPRTSGITAVSAHYLLHTYRGGPTTWPGRLAALDPGQCEQLRPPAATGQQGRRARPDDSDRPLLAALAVDARASHADLARATGWSASTVARRIATLRASGALYFDLELDDGVYGVRVVTMLWMSVAPSHLNNIGEALAEHDELAFVGATTGPTNLLALALCPDPEALHRYLTHRLAALEGIIAIETAPVLTTLKAAGPLQRSAPPARQSAV
jgi:DNA-binding Lrp family transcriptional regulator